MERIQQTDGAQKRTSAKRAPQDGRAERPAALPDDAIVGRNAVAEALKSGRGIYRLLVADGDASGALRALASSARERGAVVEVVPRRRIERIAGGLRHQGVLAFVAPVPYTELDEILRRAKEKEEPPFLLLLDELEDPHNLGAILRTADAAGVDGVLVPKRRSCPLSATVAKTSAGAVEYVPVARIGNVAQTIAKLKALGFWIVGADMGGTLDYDEADLTGALVLAVGSEGRGLARLTREACDFLVRIPMRGRIQSLNASVAGAVLMYEALRQRRKTNGAPPRG